MDHVAELVAHDLELDVARPREILLDVHVAVAERRQRLGARELERALELVGVLRDAHALAAAARRRLDDDGKADLLREARAPRPRPRPGPGVPGMIGTPTAVIALRAAALSPMTRICSAVGPMNAMLVAVHDLGELRVLGEKAVAGMDGVGAGDLGGGDEARDLEVGVARRRGADADVVVGEADVQRLAVGLGVDGDRLDAELAAGANDAQRDLAAICDQDFLEHAADQAAEAIRSPTSSCRSCRRRPARAARTRSGWSRRRRRSRTR